MPFRLRLLAVSFLLPLPFGAPSGSAQRSARIAPADMLDRNIFEVDPHTISQTKVVLTIVGGKIVHEADSE